VTAPNEGRGRNVSVETAPGAQDVLLVLDGHRTRIRVLDEKGRPLASADVGMRWVDEPFQPIGRGSVNPIDGSKNLWLEPGRRLIVAGHATGYTVAEKEVVVPDRPLSRDVDLVLHACGEDTGSLCIRLTDDHGRTFPHFAVVLSSALARSRLDRGGDLFPDPGGVIRNLRPGTFEMRVWAKGPRDGGEPSYCMPVLTPVTIDPGEETLVALSARVGGRVLVRETWTSPEAPDDLDAYVRFEKPGHSPMRPMWLDPDDDDLSRILDPGVWTLVLCGEGVQEERRPVRVAPGLTVAEDVTIAPR